MATTDEQWRDISTRLQESAVAHQQTAVILERLKGQLDLHDQRLKALENSPANNRANIQVAVAVAGLLFAMLACVIGPLIGALIGQAFQQLAR